MFQVRGILNKLTPEKFQKLSDDLLALELDSSKVLRGVILLIFEKALDEPKYSSMYAQLCKRLSEEAPNFEPPDKPCTFRLLLLNKCRSEFENRATAFEALEGRRLSAEDEEKRHLAKCKMLGNIKFIGELGKLEILAESILHRCIQQLLARRGTAAAEHHEDLECLAQLVRTVGRVLDSQRGRGLVDQYFSRVDTLSSNRELAPRIRFMLRDVLELRRNGWVPRAAVSSEGPVPFQQLRTDDDFHSRRSDPPAAPDPLFRHGLRTRSGLDDMLSGLSLSATSNNLVPPPSASDKFSFGGNGFGGRDNYRHRGHNHGQGGGGYGQRNQAGGGYNKHHQNNSNSQYNSKDVAPRFNKSRILVTPGAMEDLQMRPAANSLLFNANKLSKPHSTPLPLSNPVSSNVLTPSFASAPPLLKESSITIKPAVDKNAKPKKDKGPNKEELLKSVMETCAAACAECGDDARPDGEEPPPALAAHLQRLRALALNDKLLRLAVNSILVHALQTDSSVWVCVSLVRGIKRGSVVDIVKALVTAQHPHARLPTLLAHAVLQKLCCLSDVASVTEAGQHYPLLLEVLQELQALLGPDKLLQLYNESEVNLASSLPAEASLAEAVEARGLGALVPQLRVQAELARQLALDPSPQHLFRWIKANVDVSLRHNTAFVSSLLTLLVQYITQEAGTEGVGAGTGVVAADKAPQEKEKALVEQYAPLLTAVLEGRPALQLAAVYAVQVHAHHHHYPKGMLLRWFMYLYNLEVCEEEAFLRWREDVTDAYPGKGEALFQVNAWLTWLQQQESDEEEGDE